MLLRVFKLIFDKSSSQLLEIYEDFSEVDKEKLDNLETESYFDYTDKKGNYKVILITTFDSIDKYLKILGDYNINVKISDISENILKYKYDLEKELKYLINNENELKFEFFIDDLNDWILKNLEIDIILDRISEVGINNLTKLEKDFLENYEN
jgi:hypothetical protein